MMALVMESTERGLDQALQLADGALDGCLNRGRIVGDSDRLATGETRFHHAALVVTPALAAVLVAEVDFHPRDALLVSAERGCDDGADIIGERFASFDVVIRVDLNLHATGRTRGGR